MASGIIAVIPARRGSKGIPRKNVAEFCGKPLICWTLAAAVEAQAFDDVIVSTDCPECQELAWDYNATVVERPRDIAGDEARTVDAVRHAVQGYRFRWVMTLQPTNPLRTAEDILKALQVRRERPCDSVLAVTGAQEHPARCYSQRQGLVRRLPMFADRRRQELPNILYRDGSIYLTQRLVLAQGELLGRHIRPLVIPRERSLRIDTLFDMAYGEWLASRYCLTFGRG